MQLEKIGRQILERSGTDYSKRNYEELAQIDRTIRSLVTKEYVARKSLAHLTEYRNIDLVSPADLTQEIEDWIKNYFRAIQAEVNTFVHSDRSIRTVEQDCIRYLADALGSITAINSLVKLQEWQYVRDVHHLIRLLGQAEFELRINLEKLTGLTLLQNKMKDQEQQAMSSALTWKSAQSETHSSTDEVSSDVDEDLELSESPNTEKEPEESGQVTISEVSYQEPVTLPTEDENQMIEMASMPMKSWNQWIDWNQQMYQQQQTLVQAPTIPEQSTAMNMENPTLIGPGTSGRQYPVASTSTTSYTPAQQEEWQRHLQPYSTIGDM